MSIAEMSKLRLIGISTEKEKIVQEIYITKHICVCIENISQKITPISKMHSFFYEISRFFILAK